MLKATYLLLVLLILGIFRVSADVSYEDLPAADLKQTFLSQRWTTENGLPQNTVTSIVQTREGYLWLGTFGGLVRFDGVRFTTFNTANTPALRSNRIIKVYKDPQGTLWIGAENGDVVQFADGAFRTFAVEENSPDNIPLSFLVDRKGDLWIGRTDGLRRYREKRVDQSEFYPFKSGITSIVEDANDYIWLASPEGGLLRLEDGKFINCVPGGNSGVDFYSNLEIDSSGNLWSLLSGGLGIFKDGRFNVLLENELTTTRYLATLATDRNNQSWYGFYETIYRFGDGGDRLLAKYDVSDLTRDGIRSMLFDREDNLWIGTNGDGLIRLRPRKIKTLSTADGLPSDEIITVVEDVEGDGVWIGAVGLTYWKQGRATVYKMEDGLPANRITALAYDADQTLWVGTLGGLASFKDGRITTYPDNPGVRMQVKAIYFDRAGNLWLGRQGGGLQLFRDGNFVSFGKAEGLVNDDIRFIGSDRTGNLLLGTLGGLVKVRFVCPDGGTVCLAPEKLEFTNFTARDGLSNDFVRDIYEDDGTLWIATYGGGLNRLRDGKFVAVTVKNGLGDDFISRILPDDRGNFWLLGNRGVFSVSRQLLNDFADNRTNGIISTTFGMIDGMLSSEGNGGNQPAGWRMRDGTLWFAMLKGLAIIDPKTINPQAPPVLIEEILVDGTAQTDNENQKSGFTLTPGQENLEIHFTALSLTKSEHIKFRYKLEGIDSDWVNVGTRRAAYFPHLPPGSFCFLVAANTDGVWSEQPAVLEITVLPPFWRHWWFLLLGVGALVTVVALSYQLRLGQLQRRRLGQEEFSRRLINAHETERRRLASELHDGLGQDLLIIKNWAVLGLTTSPASRVREHLEEISATAGRALNEARNLARALRPFHLERFGLTKSIQYMAEQIESSSGIRVEILVAEIDDLFLPETEINIFRILQEILNNVVRHSEATRVKLLIERESGAVRLSVIDNGRGFEPAAVEKSGFGLQGINERVNLLNGSFTIDSAVGSGTRIFIVLPVSGT